MVVYVESNSLSRISYSHKVRQNGVHVAESTMAPPVFNLLKSSGFFPYHQV
jgi:ribosomal protein S8